MAYELRSPETESEWRAYHDIRRTVLWEARGLIGVYDENRPDEHMPNHFPKLLFLDDLPIGVLRIDVLEETAWFRRVAIIEGFQKRGHGRVLLDEAEKFAREHGAQRIESSVDQDAIGFYKKMGFKSHTNAETAMFKSLNNQPQADRD